MCVPACMCVCVVVCACVIFGVTTQTRNCNGLYHYCWEVVVLKQTLLVMFQISTNVVFLILRMITPQKELIHL